MRKHYTTAWLLQKTILGTENSNQPSSLFDVFAPSSSKVPDHSFDSHEIVKSYLTTRKPKKSLEECPQLKQAFLKYNTGLPSSAPVERLFSVGKDVLRPKRSKMSDKNFEMAMFIRANKHLPI